MRDHTPIVLESFNGLWARGDIDSCPPDHFTDCQNIQYEEGGFLTRTGIGAFLDAAHFIGNILRIYPFDISTSSGFIALNDTFQIYHIIPNVSNTLILTITGMTDFGYLKLNERAYISPSTNVKLEGMAGQFMYVYNGMGLPARLAAGFPPVDADGALAAANSGSGNVEAGIHIFGVVYETDSGFDTSIGPNTLPTVTVGGAQSVALTNIPVSPSSAVVARRIVATKAIDPALYTGNTLGYEFFFVTNGEINDNTTTSLVVNFYDAELLADASNLFDLFSEIPAFGGMNIYHGRLVGWCEDANNSIARVSLAGQPEAISQVDGLLQLSRNGHPLTHAQEYRDVLYVFKDNETIAYSDNGSEPAGWPQTVIDNGLGCTKFGCGVITDEGGINIEYLILINYSGLFVFAGIFTRPEFSYKIKDYWLSIDQSPTLLLRSQCYADPIHSIIYINIPSFATVLIGDYSVAFDYKSVKWAKWTYDIEPTTICLSGPENTLIIGAAKPAIPPIPI